MERKHTPLDRRWERLFLRSPFFVGPYPGVWLYFAILEAIFVAVPTDCMQFHPASASPPQAVADSGAVSSILGYVYFTFVCYLSIGLPLAVLPAFVHLRMGMHAALAGLVISIQYIATFLSRRGRDGFQTMRGRRLRCCGA